MEERLLAALQADLPCQPRPFLALARRFGLREEELLEGIRDCLRTGIARRYGALLNHRRAGIEANAMVVWRVAEERVEEVGMAMASDPGVTHCYQRPPLPDFPYNLYTMVHGRSRRECALKVERLAERVGVREYTLLFSTREFKRSSPAISAPASNLPAPAER